MKRKHISRSRLSAYRRKLPDDNHIEDSCLRDLSVGLALSFHKGIYQTAAPFVTNINPFRNPQAEIILDLITALHTKDPYTAAHSIRVETYASRIAKRLGLGREAIKIIRIAALLHDVGKMDISDAILTKDGPLTAEEYDAMKEHPMLGASILEPIGFLEPALSLVIHHHEWFNGKGYPTGIGGKTIPFGARVIQAADCVDAMMWPRCYKGAYPIDRVIGELKKGSAVQFDPEVAEISIDWLRDEYDTFDLGVPTPLNCFHELRAKSAGRHERRC